MAATLLLSPDAENRIEEASRWIGEMARATASGRITIVGASLAAAGLVARRALLTSASSAAFGWQRTTLGILATTLARPELARRGLTPATLLSLEAACARVVHDHRGALGRFAPIGDRPGLPRALARTVTELRLAGSPELADPDLALLVRGFEAELARAELADRALILALATEQAKRLPPGEVGPLLLVDVPVRSRREQAFIAALAERSEHRFATVPVGDDASLGHLTEALGAARKIRVFDVPDAQVARSKLARLKAGLFGEHSDVRRDVAESDEVSIHSAPGESREAVEIARLVVKEAEAGTAFDAMAVLVRAPQYGAHLEEAFRRASVPAYFARGTKRPDPSGRALLALVACAAEGLSARRFAEYLSLGEVPDDDDAGAPPPALPRAERVARPEDEALAALLGDAASEREAEPRPPEPEPSTLVAEEDRSSAFGTLRAPRHWERLLVDAAVIGGESRWERRLAGLAEKLRMDAAAYDAKGEDVLAEAVGRDARALDALRRFALPLIADLSALPGGPTAKAGDATWGHWLDGLEALATRALRDPSRVLSVLAELRPMAEVGPVDVTEVRMVLDRRLSLLTGRDSGRREGCVYVSTIEEARGFAFDVVFVPGLAEKMFPQKVVEDPLLLDDARQRLDAALPTNDDRTAEERLALRLAVGAARRRLVLSYPRLDVEQARPRTPSFYGLEILRVAEGELRGFEHLAETAARKVLARIGWPAPPRAEDAIDEAEHDLALLEAILKKPEAESVGEAHYLLTANDHLARALRFRGRRWLRAWKGCDGLVDPPEEALAAIREHALDKRSFSPTALQNFAACPYRFYLSAVHKIAPREEPAAVEDLDPLTRGSLVHEVQFLLLGALRDEGALPVTKPRLERAHELLETILASAARDAADRLAPAIDRVFHDAIEGIKADLREWLRRMTDDPSWTPTFFELSFGLKDRRDQDSVSRDEPAVLESGIRLRGSIDLVEKSDRGVLRATDYKTGKIRAKAGETVIGKGETLQPVLYALTLEKLFPGQSVQGGRLYYCTTAGDFTAVDIALDDEARGGAALVARVIGAAVHEGFLPAAPAKDACKYCDYRPVCGPYEEIRTKRKQPDRLKSLHELRRHR